MGAAAGAAAIGAIQSGTSAFFGAKSAKAIANSQAAIAAYQAETIRANKTVQDAADRQKLEQIGRQQAALTAGYNEIRGANAAEAAAGNVDISSGSVAAVQEGNAQRYAMDAAAIRRAYDLQRWQGESTLKMMDAQARGYDAMSSAYRSVAKLQGSPWANAFSATFMSLGTSYLGGKFDDLFSKIGGSNQSGGKYYDRALQKYVSSPVRH